MHCEMFWGKYNIGILKGRNYLVSAHFICGSFVSFVFGLAVKVRLADEHHSFFFYTAKGMQQHRINYSKNHIHLQQKYKCVGLNLLKELQMFKMGR